MFNINNNSSLSSSSSTSAAVISSSSAVTPSLFGRSVALCYNPSSSRFYSSSSCSSIALTTLSATPSLSFTFGRLTVQNPSVTSSSSSSFTPTSPMQPRNWGASIVPTCLLGIIGQYLGNDARDVRRFIASLPHEQQGGALLQIIGDAQSNSSIIHHILHEAEYTIDDARQYPFLLIFSRTVGIRQVPFIRDIFPTNQAINTFTTTFKSALQRLECLECGVLEEQQPCLMNSQQLDALCTACPALVTITLKKCNNLQDADIEPMSRLHNLRNLHIIQNRQFTGEGLRHLSGIPLRKVSLLGCEELRDANLQHLSELPLVFLNLRNCKRITNAGLNALYRLPLQQICLGGTRVDKFGIRQLRRNFLPRHIEIVDFKTLRDHWRQHAKKEAEMDAWSTYIHKIRRK